MYGLKKIVNTCITKEGEVKSIFIGLPHVPLDEFIHTLIELLIYLRCDKDVFELMKDLLIRLSRTYIITSRNIARILLAIALISIKMQIDAGITNKRFARLIGLDIGDVQSLEFNILKLFNYEVAPDYVHNNLGYHNDLDLIFLLV